MNKKIFILTNGCERRKLDALRLKEYFRLNHYITAPLKKADYIIFITCSFSKNQEVQGTQQINELKKYNGELIVLGCFPEIAPVKFKQIFKGKFLPTKELDEIDKFFPDFKVKFLEVPDAHSDPHKELLRDSEATFFLGGLDRCAKHRLNTNIISLINKFFTEFQFSTGFYKKCLNYIRSFYKKRLGYTKRIITNSMKRLGKKVRPRGVAYLRIGGGCIGKCTFCAIHKAIGRLKSKPLDVCLQEYKKRLDEGYRNFMLIADNIGAYGLDINSSFSELLESMSAVDKNLKINWHIQELHPEWAIKYESELLKKIEEGKISYILCPIQSGSDRILELMNRGHNSNDIARTLLGFKKANPKLIINAQVIVGFPSETNDDFLKTLELIKKIRFNHISFYLYADGCGTPASKMDDKIDKKTIMERMEIASKALGKEKGIKISLYN